MKSLHKKIGVVALSSALVLGGAVAGISHMRSLPSKGLVAEAAARIQKKHELKLPFLLQSEAEKYAKSDPKKLDENDLNMVYGLSEIFGYRIFKINPVGDKASYIKRLGGFDSANQFLRHLSDHDIEKGMYEVRVGKQLFYLQFDEDSYAGNMWWLQLDKWQYLDGQAKASYMSQLKH